MNEVDTALYAIFSATGAGEVGELATGGAHRERAPLGTTFPALIFAPYEPFSEVYHLGKRVGTADTQRIRRLRYIVKAVDQGLDPAAAYAIMARVDAKLHNAALSVSGHNVLLVRREVDQFSLPEDGPGGENYQVIGAIYRVDVQPS